MKQRTPLKQWLWEKGFLLCAMICILLLALITCFILLSGVPAIADIGLFRFLFGAVWQPSNDLFGLWPMIVVTLISTILAVAGAAVIGVMTSVFLTEIVSPKVRRIIRPCIDLLAGIPSVVYGLFGLVVIVPFIRDHLGGPGVSLLAVVCILMIMLLPTIIGLSENALLSVPREYREGSLALGVTPAQTIFGVTLPAAKQGILASIVLGTGRAVGETMAVLLVAGNRPFLPHSLLDPVRTLTANIAMEMGYAQGLHREALFGAGVVLFVFIMLINWIFHRISNRKEGA